MARLSLFLLACLVVIATEEAKETSDLTETNFNMLERVAREAEPMKRKKKNRRSKKKGRKGGRNAKKPKGNKSKQRNKKKGNRKGGKKGGTSKGGKKGGTRKGRKKGGKRNKNGMKTKRKGGMGNRNACRQVATDANCITNICEAWKMRNGPVRNFIRQTKRMVNHASISEKKLAKKAEFDSDAATLTSVLGGNASTPSCALDTSGSDASVAAVGLGKCNSDIVSSCPPITVDANFTGNGGCNKTMMDFKARVEGCGEGADAASCTCYAKAVAMKEAVSACAKEALAKMKEVKAKKDVCKKKFASCKSLQDKAVGFAATCHKGGKHGTKTTSGMMATGGMRRNRILRQLMEQNTKGQARINHAY